ncbi:hypothetical protein EDD18DRAFT_266995 [Armillaria luteobubalina]|uniref:Clathrin/coatomer adaptor adaptin-like N-terminal domain-containing protein n=1 Tax=Armillaria luteobubalina TaxID=153913 RepID=A0AA39Q4V4_9AGAR|nr:hypothetical protein EDD18DRAFT_266995 [Armillaria luteobubalina]
MMPQRLSSWFTGASAAAAGVALTPILAPLALGIVGFGAAGPVAGSLAAAIQSGIGNVAAGSAFAVAQSIGMGGAIPAGVYAVSGATAGVAGWAAGWFGSDEPNPTLIRQQLNSGRDRAKLDAMKTLIGLMSKGRDVSKYFPLVVKNLNSQNLEIQKLVYVYLLKYIEDLPDESSQEGSIGGASGKEEDIDKLDISTYIHQQLYSGSDEKRLAAMRTLIAVCFCVFFSSSTDTFISS